MTLADRVAARVSRSLPMPTAEQLIPGRSGRQVGSVVVDGNSSLLHSAVWACLRLRADLISTMPVDCYREVGGYKVNFKTPQILVKPGGERVGIFEWLYSTQFDLDQYGNAFGLITERDGMGLPARIDLVSADEVTVRVRDGQLAGYRIKNAEYDPRDVWHEKQYTRSGMHVGLSPLAYAAKSIGGYLSAQEFALDWFRNGAIPSGHFKNTAQTITPDQSEEIKGRFVRAVENRQPLVTGNDWDYEMIAATANESFFLEELKYGLGDVCRYYGVPGDIIDVEGGSSSITYANITQRNLQLLIVNIGPSVRRRQDALSSLLPAPRQVRFNPDATVLMMDPMTRAAYQKTMVDARLLAPSEGREKNDLPPFTEEQYVEFERLFARRTLTSHTTPEEVV